MSFREAMLPMVDRIRGRRGPTGFDIQTVGLKIVQRVWSGGRAGAGVLVETVLTTLLQQYKMRTVTSREIAGSGGRYEIGDIRISPITPARSLGIVTATNAAPIVITTASPHGRATGDTVVIRGALGNTAANGQWVVTVLDATSFSLNGSVGNGAYTGSGTAQICGYTPEQLKPAGATGVQIVHVLSGAQQGDYQLVDLDTMRPFRYELIVRRMRTTP